MYHALEPAFATAAPHPITGETVINGVTLPRRVLEELRRLGISLSAYNTGELEDAVEACHYDGQLVDDPQGNHFHDQLHLTGEEKQNRNRKDSTTPSDCKKFGFAERILRERDRDLEESGLDYACAC